MAAQLKKVCEVSLHEEQCIAHNIYYDPNLKRRLSDLVSEDNRLCIYAQAIVFCLLKKPAGWIVRQLWLQAKFKFGERIWRRVSRALREVGLLELKKGGNNVKDGYLRFNPFGYKPLQETITTFSEATEAANSITTIGHSINNINNINNINKTTNTRARSIGEKDPMVYKDALPANDPVVVFFKKYDKGMTAFLKFLERFGYDFVKSKILAFWQFFESGACHNRLGFLKRALEGNWTPSEKKKRIDSADRRKQEEENLEIIKNKTDGTSCPEYAKLCLTKIRSILGKKTEKKLTQAEVRRKQDIADPLQKIAMESRGEVFSSNHPITRGDSQNSNGDQNLCVKHHEITKGEEGYSFLLEASRI